VLQGVMVNKDVTHPKMRRHIRNPRVILLDCPLEYKKAESQTTLEVVKEEDWNAILKQEEDYIEKMCSEIIALKPDIVITEKGVSDLAQHFLLKANISAIRRVRKTDNNRIARVTGATIVSRADELQESDVGTDCGLFEIRKFGDECVPCCSVIHSAFVVIVGGAPGTSCSWRSARTRRPARSCCVVGARIS
jgi:T-complex protein 1 subunit gamma